MDVVLRGGLVVDGSGRDGYRADVGVRDGVIAQIGTIERGAGAEEVDLDGLVLAPGFIDVHTHFDAQVFWDPDFTPSSWHGVTTIVQGNCGFGIAPTRPSDRDLMLETLENVEGMNLQTMRAGLDWSFETFPEYVQSLKRLPKRLNVTAYVGHTPLRMYVMGGIEAAQREATDEEIGEMRRLVREAMHAGAIGFSSSQAPSHHGARGLPVPSRMASRKELRALLEEMAGTGRGIAMLTYGLQYEMKELAEISKELGVRISWGSLLTDMFGPPGEAIKMLDEAAAVGGDIWPQVSCRLITLQVRLESPNYLAAAPIFEKDVLGVPREKRAAIYRDQAWRDKARPQLSEYRPNMFERTRIAESRSHPELVGRPMLEVAA